MTAEEIAREYFPDAPNDYLGYLIWNETGYPAFWDIPTLGATPEDVFRLQLARAACRENFGMFGYLDADAFN